MALAPSYGCGTFKKKKKKKNKKKKKKKIIENNIKNLDKCKTEIEEILNKYNCSIISSDEDNTLIINNKTFDTINI